MEKRDYCSRQSRSETSPANGTQPGAAAWLFAAITLTLAWQSGCGARPVTHADRATVSGSVTLAEQPLRGGSVTFISSANSLQRVTGFLQDDGTFSIADVPLGKVDVAIDTEPMKIGAPDRYQKIPDKYRDAKTSGLSYDVSPGDNPPARFALP